MRRFGWALRRELWENRWLWLAPAYMAAALLLGFVVYAFRRLPVGVAALASAATAHGFDPAVEPYEVVEGLMMGVGLLLAFFYCADALYGERRDRSILLWKSLPVSDLETVLAKACVPVLVLPVIVSALTVALHVVMLLASSAILAAHGQSVAELWSRVRPASNALGLVFHLVVMHGLTAAPLYAWLLLVSAWAPRAPIAWGILLPLAIAFLERMAFGSGRFTALLAAVLGGGSSASRTPSSDGVRMIPMPSIAQWEVFVAPGFWVGLAVAALFLVATVRLRRSAQPI